MADALEIDLRAEWERFLDEENLEQLAHDVQDRLLEEVSGDVFFSDLQDLVDELIVAGEEDDVPEWRRVMWELQRVAADLGIDLVLEDLR